MFFNKKVLPLVLSGFGLVLSLPVLAHEDLRLNQALAADIRTTAQPYQKSSLLAQLSNLYQTLGETQLAAQLLQESKVLAKAIQQPYVQQYVMGHTANEIASNGDFDLAMQVLNQVSDTEIWVKTAWKLANKAAKANQPELTRQLLAECDRRAHSVDDLELRAELLSGTGASYRFLNPLDGVGMVYEAYGIAQTLTDPYERALHFNEAGAHFMDIKHKDKALAVFDQVWDLIDQIKSPLQQAQALAMLGGEQAEKGQRERAAKALQRAVVIAEQLPDSEATFAVRSEIARNWGQSYQFKDGIKMAERIADPYHQAEGFIRIAKNMYRQKQQAEALALLKRTEKLANRISDPYLQATVLRKLASEYEMAQDTAKVKELLAQALKVTRRITS
ncbi:hypothetical protein MMO38_03940 [Acinetobacter sp. NIPH 1852]|uniref:tetratricopeptide repeat protein n=1 Tax=Acinetobacter sp. NIPH 1852 TaxID=2923428 RepID=UPI001F4B111F|nr:hypothetical protein [Acinetobacter sp. NIPH 1852]MCH7307296.1 hypothetical protein [Acinetobacter sp. NIPH 1852]